MKTGFVLLLLSIGLLLAAPTITCSQPFDDFAPQDNSVEYVLSISHDLKYAVLKTTDWDDRGVFAHEPARVLRLRLVRVLDIEQGLFETIRELPVDYNAVEFCDTNTIIITVYSEFGPDQHLRKLMLYKFLETDSMMVLYDRDLCDSSAATLYDGGFDYAFRDSLLVYSHLFFDSTANGPDLDFNVVIRRFTADGAFPVVRVIPRGLTTRFSHDGAQILSTCVNMTDTSFSFVVYNIAGDSVTHYRFSNDGHMLQRLAENSPIYYLSLLPGYGTDIRCFDPETGTDTALTRTLVGDSYVQWFALTSDSIVYEVRAYYEDGKEESHIETLKLR